MPAGNYHFRFGAVRAISLFDATLDGQPNEFFAGAPADRLAEAYADHGLAGRPFEIPLVCLYLDMGERGVLVDTGIGPYQEPPGPGQLPAALAAAGIDPADVDAVICSHAHWDHILGNTDRAGRPAFPNARYFIGRLEYERATAPEVEAGLGEGAARSRQNLQGIRDRFQLVEPDVEILPGVRTVAAPGHTSGQLALQVSSGGADLLYLSDVVHHAIHLENPAWHCAWDDAPEQVPATRSRLCAWAAERGALVFGSHLPPHGVGRLAPAGAGWRWEPLT